MMVARRDDEAVGGRGVGNDSSEAPSRPGSVEDGGTPWLSALVALALLGLTLWYFSWGPHAVRQLTPSPSPGGAVGRSRPTPTTVLPSVTTGVKGTSPAGTGAPEEGLPEATDEVPPTEDAATASPAPEYPPAVDESGFPPAASPPPAIP